MRVAHYLIREPSGLFYFRLRVPLDLRAVVGRRIVKRAIGVRCPRQALAVATLWAARYAQAFAALRGRGMAKKSLTDELLEGIRKRGTFDYELNLRDGLLRADGPEDHARAMEALDAIGRVSPAMRAEMAARPPACKPLDIDEAIHMWGLTLPTDTPGNRKSSTSKKSKVEAFADWKRARLGGTFVVSTASRTDCAEYFIACKATTTKRGTPPAPRYIENQFLVLAGFFDWAQTSGYFPTDDNPARGHAQVPKKERKKRAQSHGWQAFSMSQMRAIFNPESYQSLQSDAARWLPLMALYTGARSNELAHLEIEDCRDFAGTPLLDFNLVGPHKSLKTDASVRLTPVHPDLIALGLWERVERLIDAGETKLFPGLEFMAQNGPANAAQRSFSRYLERLEIKPRGKGKMGMHSFRDTVINTMKLGGVRREAREEYCGHELSQRGDHDEAYGIDFTPKGLAEACHPVLAWGLDLPALRKLLA